MRFLLHPAGELEVEARAEPGAPLDEALTSAFAALRAASARENVARLGRDQGYRIEDVVHVDARVACETDRARTLTWLARRLPSRATIDVESGAPALSLLARIAPRAPEHAHSYRVAEDGRVSVESVELHVVEHCNLRCVQCCNVSPYLGERGPSARLRSASREGSARFALSVDDVRGICARLREVMRPDVLKIMGGEPLLHADIGGVLRTIRESGVAPRVRLFTNGLLLHTLDDDAFAALDELTVSSYASAPVKADVLAATEARARRFDVVLNVKAVEAFSTVLSSAARTPAEVQATYDACWLRHRCLVVRSGVFYKCTRAAYYADYHASVALEGADRDAETTQRTLGVPLAAPDFAMRVATYLASKDVLASCTHCYGSSGALTPHVQLRKRDVAAGRLTRGVAS